MMRYLVWLYAAAGLLNFVVGVIDFSAEHFSVATDKLALAVLFLTIILYDIACRRYKAEAERRDRAS